MTILMSLIFGVALFCVVAVSLSSYMHRVPAPQQAEAVPMECPESGAIADEPVVPSDGSMAFAPRDIRLPGLPELFVHKPFEAAASSMPRRVLDPVPAPLEYRVAAT